MKSFVFPTPSPLHSAFIKERPRNSGLTSVRFLPGDRLVCCDFNEKRMYLCDCSHGEIKILSSIPTIIADGTAVQTDLMDATEDGQLVVSNFYQGSQSFYRLEGDHIDFIQEIKLNSFNRCHGVRFVPGHPDLLWVSYCDTSNRFLEILDYRSRTLLHHIRMPEQMQDVAFVGNYVVASARTDHISRGGPYQGKMYATVYLFRLPDDLRRQPPQLIDTWHGVGHLDAMIEHGDRVYSANQYTDEVDVFAVSPDEKLVKLPSLTGFAMPP